MAIAATTPASAIVEPTDKSNSPEIMTKAIPTATIDTNAV